MASGTANARVVDLGGGLSVIVGTWSQTQAGAPITYAVAGGMVTGVLINPQVSAEAIDFQIPYSLSTTGDITTLTIYSYAAITAGTFMIWVSKGG